MDYAKIFSLDNPKLAATTLCRAEGQISTEQDGETVILETASGNCSQIDPVGTIIWNSLNQPTTFNAVRDEILGTYDVTEERCTGDLLIFLKDLADKKLITVET